LKLAAQLAVAFGISGNRQGSEVAEEITDDHHIESPYLRVCTHRKRTPKVRIRKW